MKIDHKVNEWNSPNTCKKAILYPSSRKGREGDRWINRKTMWISYMILGRHGRRRKKKKKKGHTKRVLHKYLSSTEMGGNVYMTTQEVKNLVVLK